MTITLVVKEPTGMVCDISAAIPEASIDVSAVREQFPILQQGQVIARNGWIDPPLGFRTFRPAHAREVAFAQTIRRAGLLSGHAAVERR